MKDAGEAASVYVGRYDYRAKRGPSLPHARKYDIHVHHPLSPYVLTILDENGTPCNIENVYQFSKVYPKLPERFGDTFNRWKWPAEDHVKTVDDEEILQPEYFRWRMTGMHHKYAVRYPAGYHARHTCAVAIAGEHHEFDSSRGFASGLAHTLNEKSAMLFCNYVSGRIHIYMRAYEEALQPAAQIKLWEEMKRLFASGVSILINEVDGPSPHSDVLRLEIPAAPGVFKMTVPLLKKLMRETKAPFGHGYTLAALLLGMKHTDFEDKKSLDT